jgi:hypothetical protein
MAIRVTRQLRGKPKEILCYGGIKTGTFWRTLETEKMLGFTSARRFTSDHAARLAAGIEGGKVETVPELATSALLQPQAC